MIGIATYLANLECVKKELRKSLKHLQTHTDNARINLVTQQDLAYKAEGIDQL